MTPAGGERQLSARYWTTVAGVSAAVAVSVALVHASPTSPHFAAVLLRSSIYTVVMASLAGTVVPVLEHALPRTSAWRWTSMIAAPILLAVVGTLIAGLAIGALGLGPHESFWSRFATDFRVVALLAVAVTVGMTVYETQRADAAAAIALLHARELEQERTRQLALEARLSSLEARLHPHFLFNALNAISALIEEDPPRAERMVERLAALLRCALDAGRRGWVPLREELTLVTDYLEIEAARLGDRLSYAIDASPEVESCAVPPLSVQTLVENSIKHAIAPRPRGGRLRVDARAAGADVVVRVWDDGPGFALEAAGRGHGLENLQGRLAERFGGRASLTVGREGDGAVVTVTMPRIGLDAPVEPDAARAR